MKRNSQSPDIRSLPILLLVSLLLSACSGDCTVLPTSTPSHSIDSSGSSGTSSCKTSSADIDRAVFDSDYHGTDNVLEPAPYLDASNRFSFAFKLDAAASIFVYGGQPGAATVSSTDGRIVSTLSVEHDDTLSMGQVGTGDWVLQYEPSDASTPTDLANAPYVSVRVDGSSYYLDVETRSRNTEDVLELTLEAYLTHSPMFDDGVLLEYGTLVVPDGAVFTATVIDEYSFSSTDFVSSPSPSSVSVESAAVTTAAVMVDDGDTAAGDRVAGDGRYATVLALTEGRYTVRVNALADIDNRRVQRSFSVSSGVSAYRARLGAATVVAAPDRVFDQGLSEGQYGVPILVRFNSGAVPDYVSILAEVWATDNVGESIRIVDHVTGILHPEPQESGLHGLALIIQARDVPQSTGRFDSVFLKILQMTDIDTGDDILIGQREVQVRGLPD